MKSRNVTLLRELLVTQLNHWALFPIVLTLVYLVNNREGISGYEMEMPTLWIWLLCSLIPFVLYITRQHIQNSFASVGVHVLVVVACTFLPWDNQLDHVMYIACSILYVVYSLRLRLRNENMEDGTIMPVVVVLIGGGALYLYHYMGGEQWDNNYILLLIVVFALYFINYYIEQYQNFLLVNESSAGHIPAKDIFRSGMGMALLYTTMVVVVLCLTANVEWLSRLVDYIQQVIKKILRALFNIYPEESSYEQTKQEVISGGIPLPESGEDPAWAWIWDVLMAIAFIATAVGLIALAVFMIRRMADYVKKNWGTVYTRKNVTENVVHEVREKCEIARSTKTKKRSPFALLSANERVRRIYKKQVLAARKKTNAEEEIEKLAFYTARTLGDRFELSDSTRIYEKARYSGEECSATDIKNIKLVAKS